LIGSLAGENALIQDTNGVLRMVPTCRRVARDTQSGPQIGCKGVSRLGTFLLQIRRKKEYNG
jgi:hypothetical protein